MITCGAVTINEGIIINDRIRTARQEFPGFWVQMMIYIISPSVDVKAATTLKMLLEHTFFL